MSIQAININNTKYNKPESNKAYKSYLDEKGAVSTIGKIKPLPAEGHLIHDSFSNSIKYFFKDIAYDCKAVRDGFRGTANDHQLGRLNDVGLKLGGIGIAGYLASKTTSPKARLMEYIGLGAFLTTMNLYPKLFINEPAKIKHGFDIDKEYIDDQGRKKSVFQDSNYIPYDLYRAEVDDENLDLIGDKMGIPRNIQNRHDIIKEQMRKIATQNNTLWMLTAGLATPSLTGLMCYGIEKAIVPAIEKARNSKFDRIIDKTLNETIAMQTDISDIADNKLSANINKVLTKYKNQILPKDELDLILQSLVEEIDDDLTSESIKSDIKNILSKADNNSECYAIKENSIAKIRKAISDVIPKEKFSTLESIFLPTNEEIIEIINASTENGFKKGFANKDAVEKIKNNISKLIDEKVAKAETRIPQNYINGLKNRIYTSLSNSINEDKVSIVSENAIEKITSFAKVIGEFKEKQLLLDKCKSMKTEFAPETILANYYDKFEKAFINELKIPHYELKKMRESEEYTFKVLKAKIKELCKNETRYRKLLEKFAKIISNMEIALNGNSETDSQMLKLINAIENNYNKTAQRLANVDSEAFKETIDKLVKEDVATLSNSINSKKELFDFLDGILEKDHYKYLHLDEPEFWENSKHIHPDRRAHYQRLREHLKGNSIGPKETFIKILKENFNDLTQEVLSEYIKQSSKGLGSAKNLEIMRIFERYQGVKNSFNRIIHTLEVFKRAQDPMNFAGALKGKDIKYIEKIIDFGEDILLKGTSSDFTMKLNTKNSQNFFRNLMYSIWQTESEEYFSTHNKATVTDILEKTFGKKNSLREGLVLDRYKYYSSRMRNIIGNNGTDFTNPFHILDSRMLDFYTQASKTPEARFNLTAQSPVDFIKGAANRKFGTQKWFRIIGSVAAGVVGVAILAQYGFGKIKNPQNIKVQEGNNANL